MNDRSAEHDRVAARPLFFEVTGAARLQHAKRPNATSHATHRSPQWPHLSTCAAQVRNLQAAAAPLTAGRLDQHRFEAPWPLRSHGSR
ncbi:hypothetical protein GUJ93_ZPchr0010g8540 [Zizania palustris]|uniref:Uncharacterized protein n=1 Tax=Zizania palustris TaxID=103762 RepID=A0A8J6BI87_ZIZPA|nr:hypothetical protein GUJ93_ZPchr0010g8540 [Zizania palustris]